MPRGRWLPALLALVALACGGFAVRGETAVPASPGPLGGPRLATPVVSVRRLPTVLAAPVADRRLRADLQAWAAGVSDTSCAVVRDADGVVVLDHRGDAPVVPASTLKLLTAAAALTELGPDHRFRTRAVAPPPTGGAIAGDLVLVGGGDPILATADYAGRYRRQPQIFTDLEGLAVAIAGAGVTRVEGSVVGDDARYDRERYVAGWPSRYIDQHSIGPLSALSVNDGFAEYPTRDAFKETVAAPDPAASAAGVLTLLLEARGVDVVGPPRSGAAPAGLPELAAIESEPLSRIVTQLLQESDNNTAELLLKEVGRAAGDPSTTGGRDRAVAVLEGEGLDLGGAALVDGSGLALEDRVTCDLLLDVLQDPATGPALREALPVAGRSGTLTDVFVGTPLEGHLAAKTGSLNTVAGLTGVVEDDDGSLTFAYVVNAPSGQVVDGSAVVASQLRLGQVLLDWPRVPDVQSLGPRPVARAAG